MKALSNAALLISVVLRAFALSKFKYEVIKK
jgi:hypothetical protein